MGCRILEQTISNYETGRIILVFTLAITAISPFEAFELSVLGKIPRSKIVVIPSAPGEGFGKSSPPDNVNELRDRLGLGAVLSRKVLLYQGALDEQRGVLQFVKLFADSFKENNEVVLLLVGDGPAKHLIERFIHEYKDDNIILLGTVPYSKMPELIATRDAGIVIICIFLPNRLTVKRFLCLAEVVLGSDRHKFRKSEWCVMKTFLLSDHKVTYFPLSLLI